MCVCVCVGMCSFVKHLPSPQLSRRTMVKKAVNHLMVQLATKEDQHKATKNVTPKDADPYNAKAKAKVRALSSDALAEALAKGERREAEMVAAQAARQEEADAAWRNWARRQDLSPVGAPPSK